MVVHFKTLDASKIFDLAAKSLTFLSCAAWNSNPKQTTNRYGWCDKDSVDGYTS